jgi:hypothetical protein
VNTAIGEFLRIARIGAASVAFLFTYSLASLIILQGDFSITVFGVEAHRTGDVESASVGWEALLLFLVVLPAVGATIAHVRGQGRETRE